MNQPLDHPNVSVVYPYADPIIRWIRNVRTGK
jgi:hypothetical protein